MTREEQAIEYIKSYRKIDEQIYNTVPKSTIASIAAEKCLEFWDMAIHALEKENIYDDKEHYVTISKALYDKLNIDYEKALSQEPCDDAVSRILTRMWNCRGKHTTSIDKVAMEQIIRDELPPVTSKSIECEDAISRDWLKTAIHNFYYGLKHTPSEEDIQAYIDVAPSVTQKSGKWIEHEIKDTCRWLTCSNCGYEWINRKENYCPNCGARMVEPQESGGV